MTRIIIFQIQTCNKAFRSIMHYAMKKGQHEQVQSDVTLSLKTATAKGAVENLMFDPEHYKCHHEVLLSCAFLLDSLACCCCCYNFFYFVLEINSMMQKYCPKGFI